MLLESVGGVGRDADSDALDQAGGGRRGASSMTPTEPFPATTKRGVADASEGAEGGLNMRDLRPSSTVSSSLGGSALTGVEYTADNPALDRVTLTAGGLLGMRADDGASEGAAGIILLRVRLLELRLLFPDPPGLPPPVRTAPPSAAAPPSLELSLLTLAMLIRMGSLRPAAPGSAVVMPLL